MAKSAVLTGRTLADLIRGTFVLLIVLAVDLLIGFRSEGLILNWVAALGLILLIDFLFIWFSALLGLVLNSVEAIQQAWTICTLPLLFASNAFVPTSTMPAWLAPSRSINRFRCSSPRCAGWCSTSLMPRRSGRRSPGVWACSWSSSR